MDDQPLIMDTTEGANANQPYEDAGEQQFDAEEDHTQDHHNGFGQQQGNHGTGIKEDG